MEAGGHKDKRPMKKRKLNTPADSCVSTKNDPSTDLGTTFREGHSHPCPRPMDEGPSSPAPSGVSMKSDQSKGLIITFGEGDGHPDPRPMDEGPSSPAPSGVSMKSDQSKGLIITFGEGDGHPDPRPMDEGPSSPAPSGVSMKSDQSKGLIITFGEGDGHPDPRPMDEGPSSPAPSGVSMKSDQSKGLIITFGEGDGHPDPRLMDEGPSSPAPSGVSMKSDQSKGLIITFGEGDGHPDPRLMHEGPSSPAPSGVSMKSDQSKGLIITFREGDGHPDPSIQQEDQTVNLSLSETEDEDDVFKELEHKVVAFMKNELKRLKKLLSPNYSDPCGEEKDQKNQRDARVGALKIAVHILRNMSQEILALKLEEYGLLSICRQELKDRLSTEFQRVYEGIPKQGKSTFLEKIYTELYITEGDSAEVNIEHEVRQIEVVSRGKVTKEDTPIKCTDIFKPLPGQDKPIRTVLTKGVAGIGKTVSVQKFILDWTAGKANQNIHFIFPLSFRELNLMRDKTFTLMEFIHHFFSETKDLTFFNHDGYNIAFIFDGLDESRLPLDFQLNECLYNITESASVDVLLTNLIKGNLLPSALVWITSRPAAALQIPPEYVHQVTEVRGFSDPQKEEYFRKKITEKELASNIISHLKSSRSLYIMCHIPVFCWMSATVLEYILTEAESKDIPNTLTQMYTHFLIIQTKHISQKYGTPDVEGLWNLETILSLGKLAFQQLEKGNLIFYEEDLRECGIDVTQASIYSGLCTQIFTEEAGLYQGKVFCFVHLSIQEFLAALYVVLHFSRREKNMPEQHQTSQLSSLFSTNTLCDLHQTAVDMALNNENGHLDLFLRFLLGLSLQSNQKLLQDLIPKTESSSLNTEETVEYIKQQIRKNLNPERCLNLFHCLNELNDHSLVEEVQGYLRKESTVDLSLSQLSAMAFVLLMSDQELKEFNLGEYGLYAKSDAGLKTMLPVVKSSTRAQLWNCNLTVSSCMALSSVLSSNSSSLRQLNLSYNSLGGSGVEKLSTGLEHPNCRLETLQLSSCCIKAKSCAALSSAFSSNSSSLRHLDLSYNTLGDLGVELLSTGLKHPNCRVEKLELWDCLLTEVSCKTLSSVLSSNSSSLRHLHLSYNDLGDSGVALLSTGLEHPNCRLEILELWDCNLTEKSCAALSSVLSANSSSLRQLNLNQNNLGDSGVENLSTGLQHPNCRLKSLELQKCNLTVRSCSSLAAALRSNPSSLRELDLRNNSLQQSGVDLLSALQRDPTYKLTELKVAADSAVSRRSGPGPDDHPDHMPHTSPRASRPTTQASSSLR